MVILSIKTTYHDTGASILRERDGGLEVFAISEARLNRVKHSTTFPLLSIDYCLAALGLNDLSQVDRVVFEQFDGRWPAKRTSQVSLDYDAPFAPEKGDFFFNFITEQAFLARWPKYEYVHHVDAHAASAYFASPFDDAGVLVVEGGTGIYRGSGTKLTPIDRYGYHGDLIHNGDVIYAECEWGLTNTAALYSLVTSQILGLSGYDCGKTMALAAYNSARPDTPLLRDAAGRILDFLVVHNETLAAAWRDLPHFDPRKETKGRDALLDEPWVSIARQAQQILERDMNHLGILTQKKSGSNNLCLAGGVALSCVNNRRLLDSGQFDQIFIQPAASDEGIPLGAALAAYYATGGSRRWRMDRAYLGRPNDPTRLEGLLGRMSLPFHPAPVEEVARLIADGKIIGRCFGASEYGPRALGNRSILADPRRADMVERLNREIKHREGFRPFAPSCLWERANEYFDMPVEGPFMIMAAQVRESVRGIIPAASHVDGSSRPQTVRRDQNPEYYDLIKAFGDLTGVYVLINTSFNDNEEPIVETYEDALIGLVTTNLDYLYVDGLLVARPTRPGPLVQQLKEERNHRLSIAYGSLIDRFCDRATWDAYYNRLASGERIKDTAATVPSWI